MRLVEISSDVLAEGIRELTDISLAVTGAQAGRVAVPECKVLGIAGSIVVIQSDQLDLARNSVRSMRHVIRDVLEVSADGALPPTVSADYTDLLRLVEALREILEGLLSLPLTFPGETRTATGVGLTVHQTVDWVRGVVIGLRAPWAAGMIADIDQRIKFVEQGGRVVGMDLSAGEPNDR